jgi:replicative DNA helicase
VNVDITLDSMLPCNVDAERTLLGACLLDNAAWPEIAIRLRPADFSLDSHRRIGSAMKRLADANSAIDIVTLANELSRTHEVEAVGGVAYLASLTEGLPRRPVIDEYIRIVKDKSMLRSLILMSSDAIQRAQDQSETALEVAADMVGKIEKLAEPAMQSNKAPIQSHIVELMDRVVREYTEKTPRGIPTGNAWLDAKMGGGYRKGRYTIVAARPKVGKTGMGVLSAAYNCLRGTRVVWFSLEMDHEEVELNLVPHVVDLPNIVVVKPELRTPEQQSLVMHGLYTIGEWPLTIYDGDMDCDQICWAIDREARKDGDVLFVLDHFGLIAGGDRDIRKRYVENSERLRKKIKQHKNAALLNLFQLGEVPREFADKRPQPGDISESKKPLQDCFAMVLLHRYQDKETLKMTRKANINLALIRGGGSPGNVDGEFNPRKLCFEAEAEIDYEGQDYYA